MLFSYSTQWNQSNLVRVACNLVRVACNMTCNQKQRRRTRSVRHTPSQRCWSLKTKP